MVTLMAVSWWCHGDTDGDIDGDTNGGVMVTLMVVSWWCHGGVMVTLMVV